MTKQQIINEMRVNLSYYLAQCDKFLYWSSLSIDKVRMYNFDDLKLSEAIEDLDHELHEIKRNLFNLAEYISKEDLLNGVYENDNL